MCVHVDGASWDRGHEKGREGLSVFGEGGGGGVGGGGEVGGSGGGGGAGGGRGGVGGGGGGMLLTRKMSVYSTLSGIFL